MNLLSALKLFFTYGEKTIFFCGIDKKAVNEAVKTKYGKVIKANEYLEKIFDISFSMPLRSELLKLVSQYFKDEKLKGVKSSLEEDISDFFTAINFTNPRRVKKVLNKFLIIKNLKEQSDSKLKSKIIIPSILTKLGGNFLETVIVLYLIIINEFHPSILEGSFNLESKLKIFEKAVKEKAKISSSNNPQSHISNTLNHAKRKFVFVQNKILNEKISIHDILNNSYASTPEESRRRVYISDVFFLNYVFCPTNIEEMTLNSFEKKNYFIESFRVENTLIDYYFTEYLLKLFEESYDFKDLSLIPLIEFKDIIKTIF